MISVPKLFDFMLQCNKEVNRPLKTEYILLIILGVLVIYLFVCYLLYTKMIRHKGFKNGGLVDQNDPFFQPSYDWFVKSPKESVHIKGYDGVKLTGSYLPSFDEKSTLTAIVLHGYAGINTDMAIIAKNYSDLGFKVLLPDLRGHGLSEGDFSTFGHYESYDLKKWINFILRTYGSTDSILLHGVSMGAATVLLTAAMDLPTNVRLIVADSPYSSVAPVLVRKAKTPLILFFLPGLSLLTWYWHRFFLMLVSVSKAVRKSLIPTVFIHGIKDEFCPYRHTLRMMESSKAPFKDIYTVLEARHAESYKIEKKGIDAWLSKIIQERFNLKLKRK